MKSAACLATNCFCEGPYFDSLILQPVNTLSAFLFFLPIFFIWNKQAQWGLFYKKIYIFSLSFLAIGTIFFHASLTELGQWSDGMGLYAVITFIGLYFIQLRLNMSHKKFLLVYSLLNFSSGLIAYFYMPLRLWIFGSFIACTFFIICWNCFVIQLIKIRTVDFVLSILAFSVGLFFQVMDNKLIWCSPFSWLQGHALWHLLTAYACYRLYLLMESAHIPSTKIKL